MQQSARDDLFRSIVYVLVSLSGFATLSWEVIWQLKSSLALGVSAQGTALTLAVTMGGMGVGALAMGRMLREKAPEQPIRVYGLLEVIIGIAGLLLGVSFHAVERLDTVVYGFALGAASLVHVVGIAATLGIPTVCMGATLPVFGLIARQFRTSLAMLYGLNTLGAAAGTLLVAFIVIPECGVAHAGWAIAALNMAIGFCTWVLAPGHRAADRVSVEIKTGSQLGAEAEKFIVVVTGFATLSLEVAWFRSLTAAFQSTTYAFAIMLASVLIALGLAARLVPFFRRMNVRLGTLVSWAGIFVLLATPFIERFDLFVLNGHSPNDLRGTVVTGAVLSTDPLSLKVSAAYISILFGMSLLAFLPPMTLLGAAFPWIIDEQDSPQRWGKLYALNTFATVVGALSAAWIFLPTIGFARTAWISGVLLVVAGVAVVPGRRRVMWAALGIAALAVAFTFESGVGRTRAQGARYFTGSDTNEGDRLVGYYEGPSSTVSVSENAKGRRVLMIDGSSAAAQSGQADDMPTGHYFFWMGSLPMLAQENPKNALVICFGTGQTANAVRKENPQSLDIVDINPNIFKLAHNFPANEDVLKDPRVRAIVMDGRAYMRRSTKTYDVITLEPMPPNLAGVNALYDREFYELARKRLSTGGVIAQWLPFHTIAPPYAASIARTFREVFPNAILWFDAVSGDGILLGSKDPNAPLGRDWPGFARNPMTRNLSEDEVRKSVIMDQAMLKRYSSYGKTITDDNQLLAYGRNVVSVYALENSEKENQDFMEKLKSMPENPE